MHTLLRDILTTADKARATALLHSQGLLYPDATDYGVGLYSGDTLVATGFLGSGRLMGLCVTPELRGEGLALLVVDHLIKEAVATGCGHLFIFTKAAEAASFAATGFELLTAVPGQAGAALLEWGTPRLADWLHAARCATATPDADAPDADAQDARNTHHHTGNTGNAENTGSGSIGAVVVNANPFTRGHLWLLERAAAQCARLDVFVVQEDVSVFSFATRLDLVRRGTAHLPNCRVLPGGEYIISRHTFPTYFTGVEGRAAAHAALDATLFASRIAPELGITARFVGSEPLSPVTALYNAALRTILPAHGMALHELPRLEEASQPVSASRVRALLTNGNLDAACALTPPETADFLRSKDGLAVIQRLQTQ